MKVLELFSGTASFSNVAKERGHEVFTVDIDKQFNPDLCIDILDFNIDMLPEEFRNPDIVWASPPCQTFSIASVYRYWKNHKPINEKCLRGLAIAKKTTEIIKQLNPKFYIIENPMAMLRKQDFMQEFPRTTVTYCQYGHSCMKPTDLWNNFGFVGKRCKNGASCHERASRSSKKGTQAVVRNKFFDVKDAVRRAIVPRELCLEVIKHCEEFKKTQEDTQNE